MGRGRETPALFAYGAFTTALMPLGVIAGEAFQVFPSAEKDILPGHELVMKRVPSVQRTRPGESHA